MQTLPAAGLCFWTGPDIAPCDGLTVAVQPVLGHLPNLVQRIEDAAVRHLGSVGLVESLDISVLRGLARLDVVEGNALGLRPFGQSVSNELGAVVNA